MGNHKFRIYDPLDNSMEDFSFKSLESSTQGAIFTKGGICIERDDIIIMQYLGKNTKDHQGIELCEGDICKFANIKDASFDPVGMVAYKNNGFRFEYKLMGYHWAGESNFDWTRLVKIGNIYQNPDLLENKHED